VKIPSGVSDGNYLTLNGQGHVGRRGGAAGDAIVIIQELEHEIFIRDGDDVILDLDLTFPQAALGAEVDVPTLSGHALLKIQPGTKPGQILRMRDKGDQLVRININMPAKLTKEEKALIEQLTEMEHFRTKESSAHKSDEKKKEARAEEAGVFESFKNMFS
jgi:molecular chaperone DnaJ